MRARCRSKGGNRRRRVRRALLVEPVSAKYPRRINCEMAAVLAGCDARRPIRRSASPLGGPLQAADNAAARRPEPQTLTIYLRGYLSSKVQVMGAKRVPYRAIINVSGGPLRTLVL